MLALGMLALSSFFVSYHSFNKGSFIYFFSLTKSGRDASFLLSTARSIEYSPNLSNFNIWRLKTKFADPDLCSSEKLILMVPFAPGMICLPSRSTKLTVTLCSPLSIFSNLIRSAKEHCGYTNGIFPDQTVSKAPSTFNFPATSSVAASHKENTSIFIASL